MWDRTLFMPLLWSLVAPVACVATNMALLTELSTSPPQRLRRAEDACKVQGRARHSVRAEGRGHGAHGVTRPTWRLRRRHWAGRRHYFGGARVAGTKVWRGYAQGTAGARGTDSVRTAHVNV